MARLGPVGLGKARISSGLGKGCGWVRRGKARPGLARRGKAWQGLDSYDQDSKEIVWCNRDDRSRNVDRKSWWR